MKDKKNWVIFVEGLLKSKKYEYYFNRAKEEYVEKGDNFYVAMMRDLYNAGYQEAISFIHRLYEDNHHEEAVSFLHRSYKAGNVNTVFFLNRRYVNCYGDKTLYSFLHGLYREGNKNAISLISGRYRAHDIAEVDFIHGLYMKGNLQAIFFVRQELLRGNKNTISFCGGLYEKNDKAIISFVESIEKQ